MASFHLLKQYPTILILFEGLDNKYCWRFFGSFVKSLISMIEVTHFPFLLILSSVLIESWISWRSGIIATILLCFSSANTAFYISLNRSLNVSKLDLFKDWSIAMKSITVVLVDEIPLLILSADDNMLSSTWRVWLLSVLQISPVL